MASSTKFAGTWANDASLSGYAWVTPSNAGADDANITYAGHLNSQYLKGTNCGFAIPGATIDGIIVQVQRWNGGSGSYPVYDKRVRLVKGGIIGSTDKSAGALIGTSPTTTNFGGISDLWGDTWTDSDINASNFGSVYAADVSTSGVIYVDYMHITVYYTEGGDGHFLCLLGVGT